MSCCAAHPVPRAEYIGNGLIEVIAAGGAKVESDEIRSRMYKLAYEECVDKDKGFTIVEPLLPLQHWVTTGWIIKQSHAEESYRMVIKCEGSVDDLLRTKYANSKD